MKELLSLRTERSKTYVIGNKRRTVFHCKPVHFMRGKGDWEEIILDFQDDGKGNFLVDKSKVSIGFRKDRKFFKYFGLRRDYEHQFEGSLVGVELDGLEKVTGNSFNSFRREDGKMIRHVIRPGVEIINRINEVSLIRFVKVLNPIIDFRIVEELHLKGLSCSNKREGSRYVPGDYGRFNFVDERGELVFWINPPYFTDSNSQVMHSLTHELEEVHGHLFYTKTPTSIGKDDLVLAHYPILIDTNTYYSSTSDGQVIYSESAGAWDTAHDATAGTYVSSTDNINYIKASVGTGKGYTEIRRCFFYFDTSSLPNSAVITATVLKIHNTVTEAESDVCAQEGNQADTLTTADYIAFTGSEYGHVTWGATQWNSIIFNDTGKSRINKMGVTKICCREYSHDYLDVPPGDNVAYNNAVDFADNAGLDIDPKLEVDYRIVAMTTKTKYWGA